MSSPLKVIALISGGKDSLFSILHCLANGHTVVALANLYPPASGNADDDLNSYMYQTVGHSVIPLYEEALGIPLFREEIRGTAVNSAREYAEQKDDETESLVPLLKRVMVAHPEANAVSTGAIFSTYQRTRVENVAVRLGLTTLSYLWQFPFLPPYTQSSLLLDMQAVGQDARIIKVASGGLDESFLWTNVADPRTVARMKKAIGRFSEGADGALLGEGGEFETLAVDGPDLLWTKKIDMESDGVVLQSGGTATWKGKAGRVVEKHPRDTPVKLGDLRRPPVFDDEFLALRDADLRCGRTVTTLPVLSSYPPSLPLNRHFVQGNTFICANITGETAAGLSAGLSAGPKEQLTNIFLRLTHALSIHGILRDEITHCTLLLRDMANFSEANSVYAKYFNYINPPSRVTVAVGESMPPFLDIMLSISASTHTPRTGLHVQSHSYWAPANIGPYSQSICTPLAATIPDAAQHAALEVHIAGQIALHPPSMMLYSAHGFQTEALLSLQHLWRIARHQGVRWWPAGVAFIPHSAARDQQHDAIQCVQALWRALHVPADDEAEGDELDAWDRRNLGPAFNDRVARTPVPDYAAVSSRDGADSPTPPPCFVCEVEALPRGAAVEWACSGVTSQHIRVGGVDAKAGFRGFVTEVGPVSACVRYLSVEIESRDRDVAYLQGLGPWAHGTLYAAPGFDPGKWAMEGLQWVPCKHVWGEDGREVRGVVVGRI